jgi:serine/threonine protein kinase
MPEHASGEPIDRYVVLEYLAEGGMGAIYLGKKMGAGGFEKQVVLKQLLPEFTQQPEFIDLFLREARLSATLDHANIIHTIDLVTAGEEHFIVMEYLDGADLRSLLKKAKARRSNLSAAAGIYVGKELLSALAYAHNKHGNDGNHLRLIHRDISPSNVLISANGEVKLTDFGIAKAATHNSVFYRVKGKVGYMSPEQARSEDMDARSDLYSLAVCLFEMITGERLLVSAGITTSADELYSRPVPLVSKKVPGLPAELDKVMLRALSVDPDHRYQSAAEFQEALLRCAHRNGLMMSAPELSSHLRTVCGDHSTWRLDGSDAAPPAGGTEIYDNAEGTQQLDYGSEAEFIDDDDVLAFDSGFVKARASRQKRAKTSMTLLGDLQGVELTSMAALGASGEGAKPLVDLSNFGGFAQQAGANAGPPPPATGKQAAAMDDPYTGVVILQGTGKAPERDSSSGGRPGSKAQKQQGRGSDAVAEFHESERGLTARPLLMLTLIILAGVGTAAAVGLTGPTLNTEAPSGSEMDRVSPPSSTAE